MFEIKGKFNTAKVFASAIDEETIGQIQELCNQSWAKDTKIAIMPDCHAGKGCTIGTTMTIVDKVCPNLVGVDIGCGMLTIELPKELNDLSLEKLDAFISSSIPAGFSINEKRCYNPLRSGLKFEKLKCHSMLENKQELEKAVGSLGGGNHFIEIDKDDEGNLYLVIHTGSHNLGKQVADIYQKIAFKDCSKQKERRKNERELLISSLINLGKAQEIEAELKRFDASYQEEIKIQKDLCYLEGYHMADYLHDMDLCQRFAQLNRKTIALGILEHLFKEKYNSKNATVWVETDKSDCGYEDENVDIRFNAFETIHNYINRDDHILRKGAISAKENETILIPINMRDGAIIAIGKGNPEYNYSGPHGAGRLMSRSEAKDKISMEEFQESMKGIYSTSVIESTLDESPMSYKSLEDILDNISESIEIIKRIKPIYNFKAH